MAKGRNLFANVRLVYRRSSPLLKSVVLVTIVASIAAVLFIHANIEAIGKQTKDLQSQGAQLEQENSQLEDKIDKQGTVEGTKDVAKDELGYEEEDATIYEPKD